MRTEIRDSTENRNKDGDFAPDSSVEQKSLWWRGCFSIFSREKQKPPTDPNPNVQDTINKLPIPPKEPNQRDSSTVQAQMQVDVFGIESSSSITDEQRQMGIGQFLPQRGRNHRISSTTSIGQDQAFKKVCEFLSKDEVGMVGIYGMGGVGKTTLMKKIRKEFLEPSSYKVIWVVVSKSIDMDNIQKDIMEEINLPFNKDERCYRRAEKISKAFNELKVALLFDDIWESLDMEQLGILDHIDFDISLFKLIFTTRSEKVCSKMQPDLEIKVDCLGWDDSWALFEKHVGRKTLEFDSEIVDLAKEVAKECKGLPLALTVIGRAMTCTKRRQEWEHALATLQKSPSEFLDAEKNLFALLKLSYDNLPDHGEKECFLCCCLYPEDEEMCPGNLVEYWIAEGLLALNDNFEETCNRGYNIIGILQTACLLEQSGDDALKMHDIIRDMGLWIGSELKLNLFIHEGFEMTKTQIANTWRNAHRIYVLKGDVLPEQPLCLNLSTLIFNFKYPKFQILNSFFRFMCRIRILVLYHIEFLDFPVGIGQLVELRYLHISDTNLKALPTEIGNLNKLEVLHLYYNNLLELPTTIGQLVELRNLIVDPCPKVLPAELGNLSKLEILFLDNDHIEVIPSLMLNNMSELRTLHLKVTSIKILPEDLWDLSKLKALIIDCWGEDLDGPEELPDVEHVNFIDNPDGLEDREDLNEPPSLSALDHVDCIDGLRRLSPSLRHLYMRNWPITSWDELLSALQNMDKLSWVNIAALSLKEFVLCTNSCLSRLKVLVISSCLKLEKIHVGHMSLQNLCKLEIRNCRSLKYIYGLQHLQGLVELIIVKGEMEELIMADRVKGHVFFPNLKLVEVRLLYKLKSICSDDVFFPSLRKFNLEICPKLEKLPRGLMNENRTLEHCMILGSREWWDKLLWQDDEFKSFIEFKSSSFTNDSDSD